MAPRPVLDTDILIDYLRGSGPGRDLVKKLLAGTGYAVTAVTAFELALGRSYRSNPRPVHALLAVPVLELTRKSGLRAGDLLTQLRDRGQQIDIRDAMQAGICLEFEAAFITRNGSHFARVPGLTISGPGDWPD